MAIVGVIGGSGLYQMEGMTVHEEVALKTPFGDPSGPYVIGEIGGIKTVFLPRHGKGHRYSPSEINYRANIFGMKMLGVEAILSVSAVGSLKEGLHPSDFILPDQFIDRTYKRENTFFTDGIVAHVSFADPTAPELRSVLVRCSEDLGIHVVDGGTYVCIEGPQFSTRAESLSYRSQGIDIIGMTNATEAKLAREAEISYATIAAVTDYDCWHQSHETVSVEMIVATLTSNVERAQRLLAAAIRRVGALTEFSAAGALQHALITHPASIPDQRKKELAVLIGRYVA